VIFGSNYVVIVVVGFVVFRRCLLVCVSFGKWGEGGGFWSDLSGCFVVWWVVWWKEGWLFWGV